MACYLPTYRRTQIIADLKKIEEQLTNLSESFEKATENSEVEEYRFSSGEGSQMTKRRSPKEIQQLIDILEAKRDRLNRKLNGQALINLNLRRK